MMIIFFLGEYRGWRKELRCTFLLRYILLKLVAALDSPFEVLQYIF
jgi:hypothetical protein